MAKTSRPRVDGLILTAPNEVRRSLTKVRQSNHEGLRGYR